MSSSSWQFKKQLTHIPRQFFTSVFLAWRCSWPLRRKRRETERDGEKESLAAAAVFRKMKNSLVCFPARARQKGFPVSVSPGQKDDVALNLVAISSPWTWAWAGGIWNRIGGGLCPVNTLTNL